LKLVLFVILLLKTLAVAKVSPFVVKTGYQFIISLSILYDSENRAGQKLNPTIKGVEGIKLVKAGRLLCAKSCEHQHLCGKQYLRGQPDHPDHSLPEVKRCREVIFEVNDQLTKARKAQITPWAFEEDQVGFDYIPPINRLVAITDRRRRPIIPVARIRRGTLFLSAGFQKKPLI